MIRGVGYLRGRLAAAARPRRPLTLVIVVLLLGGGCGRIRVPDPAVRYIAFGDSSTSGPSTRDYPDVLRELLGEPAATFTNEGRSGENTTEGLVRLEALISEGFYPNAEVLLYWEGGNDVTDFIKEHDRFLLFSPDDPAYPFSTELIRGLDGAQANVESAIATGQQAGLEVYVATYYFLREEIAECGAFPLDLVLPFQAQAANAYLVRLNARLRTAAANSGAILVDVADDDELLRPDRANYFDCNHLSEQGNTIVADLFVKAINDSMD